MPLLSLLQLYDISFALTPLSQLKLLLKLRVWEGISPRTLQEEYVGGLMVGLPPSPSIGALGLSEEDMEATLDLRRYMDPAPFAMVARTPLPRVYRLFNEIGARHLVVINDNMSPIGMVTCGDGLQSGAYP